MGVDGREYMAKVNMALVLIPPYSSQKEREDLKNKAIFDT